MTFKERFFARHDVTRHMPIVLRDTLGAYVIKGVIWKIRTQDDAFYAGQGRSLRRIDRQNPRVRVRRA